MPINISQQDGGDDGSARDSADAKRHAMRVALGRRMKRDLVEREQERLRKVQYPFIDSVVRYVWAPSKCRSVANPNGFG